LSTFLKGKDILGVGGQALLGGAYGAGTTRPEVSSEREGTFLASRLLSTGTSGGV
jgi:hypothetical protein